MRLIEKTKDLEAFLGLLGRRASGGGPVVRKRVEAILEDVRRRGDRALVGYTKKFDGHSRIRLKPDEIKRHSKGAKREVLNSLKLFAGRIRAFHEKQKERSWSFREEGMVLGQIIRPLERVGVYVPGGKAAYPSSVLMNVIPAKVAGVKEIALAVPAPGGEINPHVMAAVGLLGITEVYTIGGAQAVGAFAFGTETVRKADKIVGPGNVYVATAKRLVFGEVDIDMVAGPSEILIIADSTARPDFIAADLLSQAEHDELASSVLVTDSKGLALRVMAELKRQLGGLKRKDVAGKSIKRYGAAVLVGDMKEAVEFSNRVAPEHLEVMTAYPKRLLPLIKNAGAIFLGQWSAEPVGDYGAGPNHTLPTGGTARFSSPLGVYDFIKRSSLLEFTEKGFMRLAGAVSAVAECEGLDAHANAVRIRQCKARSSP